MKGLGTAKRMRSEDIENVNDNDISERLQDAQQPAHLDSGIEMVTLCWLDFLWYRSESS